MSVERFDVVVVGGGIVGVAVAAELTARGRQRVLLLEKEPGLARHQTGRNSGVVHSGLYYRPGSTKARLCVAGAQALSAFCSDHRLPFERVGKVVVATDERQLPALDALADRGRANGVAGLVRVDAARLRELEPHARGVAALHSPNTAITDFSAVVHCLAEQATGRGAQIRTGVRVVDARSEGAGVRVRTTGGELLAARVVNCAGLHADRVARASGRRPDVRIVPFRGEYYTLRREARGLVRGLIYPVPDPRLPFLGVHFTRRVDGGVEAGPNAVLALAREGYRWRDVNPRDVVETLAWPGFWGLAVKHWRAGAREVARSCSRAAFAQALRALVPEVRSADLERAPAGVRAQAVDRGGRLLDDFELLDDGALLHVLNAPSPAATASLAIADEIATQMGE